MTEHVCVQGLGFVGAAMAVATARAGFRVVGLDLPTETGLQRIGALNDGRFPFASADPLLLEATASAHRAGRLSASSDPSVLGTADVIVVDIHFDVVGMEIGRPSLDFTPLIQAAATIGRHARENTLVLVETTVPPGTCEKVIRPALDQALAARGMSSSAIMLAHSYERVMPGEHYLGSITDFWRVYAGEDERAADACQDFLSRVISVRDFPLTRLASLRASETAKVLENSYRAVTIAFMEEWGRFAEATDIDLFLVIDAIRKRPTHNNMRQPGFGVGGYCLTKDPLFAPAAAATLFERPDLDFPFSRLAVATNQAMPLVSLDRVEQLLGGLDGRSILVLGVSYRQDVADTRHSPTELFARAALRRGARVHAHDPLVSFWSEMGMDMPAALPPPESDAVVFAVPHKAYRDLDIVTWLGDRRPVLLDANAVLTGAQRDALTAHGIAYRSIGRGGA